MPNLGNEKNEYEIDALKKRKKYYRKELRELGIDFNKLDKKLEKQIIDFFLNLSSNDDNQIQLINSIKKGDKKGIDYIYKKLNKTDKNYDEHIINLDLSFMVTFVECFERLIELNGNEILINEYKRLILSKNINIYNENIKRIKNALTKYALKSLNSTIINYSELTIVYLDYIKYCLKNNGKEYQIKAYEQLIIHLKYSLENIYFFKNISVELRKKFYENFINLFNSLKRDLKNLNEKENKISTKDDYKDIVNRILLFSCYNNMWLPKLKINVSKVREVITVLKEKYKKMEIVEIIGNDNIKFSELVTKDITKDNNFNQRINKLKNLMEKFHLIDGGLNMGPAKEILDILYLTIYKGQQKLEINGKEKTLSTIVDYFLNENDDQAKEILQEYIKIIFFIVMDKEKEVLYREEIHNLFLEVLFEVRRGTISENININFNKLIDSFIEWIKSSEELYVEHISI